MLFENISPCYERPPVLRDHFGLAQGVVSQDRDHCIYIRYQTISPYHSVLNCTYYYFVRK